MATNETMIAALSYFGRLTKLLKFSYSLESSEFCAKFFRSYQIYLLR